MSPGIKMFELLCDYQTVKVLDRPITHDTRPKPGLYICFRPGGKPVLYVSGADKYNGYLGIETGIDDADPHVKVLAYAMNLGPLLQMKLKALDLEAEFKKDAPSLE